MVDCVVPVSADNPLAYNLMIVSLYTHTHTLDHPDQYTRGFINAWCKISLVALTLLISCHCFGYCSPQVQWDCYRYNLTWSLKRFSHLSAKWLSSVVRSEVSADPNVDHRILAFSCKTTVRYVCIHAVNQHRDAIQHAGTSCFVGSMYKVLWEARTVWRRVCSIVLRSTILNMYAACDDRTHTQDWWTGAE